MLTSEALEALFEACLNNEAGELEPFLRRSRKDEKEEMLPGLRSLSKMERLSLSSPNWVLVGDSVITGGSARCRSFESKYGIESSKESDFGRGIEPLMLLESRP